MYIKTANYMFRDSDDTMLSCVVPRWHTARCGEKQWTVDGPNELVYYHDFPGWLGVGQLWEKIGVVGSDSIILGTLAWKGYWWKLVEDNSIEKCIVKGCTNTSENGKVENGLCSTCREILVSGKPQPTESILSVIGKCNNTCETADGGYECECMGWCSVNGEEHFICMGSMIVDAQYGEKGCMYARS
jgi:hypothetical protein